MDETSSVKKPPMMAIFPEFQKTWATSKLLLSFCEVLQQRAAEGELALGHVQPKRWWR